MPVQDQERFREVLYPYFKNIDLFTFPERKAINLFNTYLSAVQHDSIPNPAKTILLYTTLSKDENSPITSMMYITYGKQSPEEVPLKDWPTARKSLDWQFPRVTQDLLPIRETPFVPEEIQE